MIGTTSNERLLRFLKATPDQQKLIDKILDGSGTQPPVQPEPLLLGMGAGAKLLGVSRVTLWRMIKTGKLPKVEVLPGSFRLRRADLEAVAAGSEVAR
jgi:excisionase family DNA binding protein